MNNVDKKKVKEEKTLTVFHYQAISKIVSFKDVEFTEMSKFLADAIITECKQ